jgi:hypothetical protein
MINTITDSEGRVMAEGDEKSYNTTIVKRFGIEDFRKEIVSVPVGYILKWNDPLWPLAKFVQFNGEKESGAVCDKFFLEGHSFVECFGPCFIEMKYLGK